MNSDFCERFLKVVNSAELSVPLTNPVDLFLPSKSPCDQCFDRV